MIQATSWFFFFFFPAAHSSLRNTLFFPLLVTVTRTTLPPISETRSTPRNTYVRRYLHVTALPAQPRQEPCTSLPSVTPQHGAAPLPRSQPRHGDTVTASAVGKIKEGRKEERRGGRGHGSSFAPNASYYKVFRLPYETPSRPAPPCSARKPCLWPCACCFCCCWCSSGTR